MKEKPSVEIRLSNSSLKAIIDEEDYLLVSQYTWRAKKDKGIDVAYVATSKRINGHVRTIRLHRLVMNAQTGMDVHHKDCNPFNNRKSNLEEIPEELHRGHPKAHITEYEDECPI
jgi:hypothetical protein